MYTAKVDSATHSGQGMVISTVEVNTLYFGTGGHHDGQDSG